MNNTTVTWSEAFISAPDNHTDDVIEDENVHFIGVSSVLSVLTVLASASWFLAGKPFLRGKLYAVPGPGRNVFESTYIFIKFFKQERSLSRWLHIGTKLYGSGGLFQFNVLTREHAVITSAETAEKVLNNIVHVEKPMGYSMIRDFFGQSLPVCKARIWRDRRKILNPAFNNHIIDRYIPTFNEKGEDLKNAISKYEGVPVDVDPIVTNAAISSIMETALGLKWQVSLTNAEVELTSGAIHEISKLYNERLVNPWQWVDPLYHLTPMGRHWRRHNKNYKAVTLKIITNRKKELELMKQNSEDFSDAATEGKKERASFLDLLLNMHMNEGTIDMQVIQDEVKAFLFAGHDTVSISLSWALFLLGHNPDIQAKARQEIDEVMGDNKEVEAEHLKQLVYLECVFKEAIRLFPAGPFIGRKLCETVKTAGYTLPKGTELLVSIYDVHRDPKCYTDPERFDPDRFLPENSAGRNPYSFIGFSGGPRGCIGQRFALFEGKIFLSWILRHFTVQSLTRYNEIEFTQEIMLRSRFGTRLLFKNRTDLIC